MTSSHLLILRELVHGEHPPGGRSRASYRAGKCSAGDWEASGTAQEIRDQYWRHVYGIIPKLSGGPEDRARG